MDVYPCSTGRCALPRGVVAFGGAGCPAISFFLLLALLFAGCGGGGGGGGGGGTPLPPASAQLTNLTLNASQTLLRSNETAFVTVSGEFDDGSTLNVTPTVTWIVGSPGVISVSPSGVVTPLSEGSTNLQAQIGGVFSNILDLAVVSGAVSIRMNAAGGPVLLGGQLYEGDMDFSGNNPGFDGGDPFVTGNPISNVQDEDLFQSVRFGDFAFRVPGLQGSVGVRLHLVEPFFQQAGQRVFRITMEGVVREPGLDIAMTVGAFAATTQDYVVNVSDGVLDIEFSGIINNAVVAGVEVLTGAPPSNSIQSLSIDPANFTVNSGQQQGVSCIASFNDGSMQDLTAAANWVSADPAIVSVVAPGLLLGEQAGTTTVSAELSGFQAAVTVTVVDNGSPRQGLQWYPPMEWSITHDTFVGSPHDVIATATFTHSPSGETRQTPLFYDGNDTWRYRFTGTRPGSWSYVTTSADADLDGLTGNVVILPNPTSPGFVRSVGTKWIREGTGRAFIPQRVMYAAPHYYASNPTLIDQAIQTFFVEHGFNGFHVPVYMRWFDIDQDSAGGLTSFDPDLDTLRALESLIRKSYEAGGTVHLWLWGDEQASQTPDSLPGGYGGAEDLRILRAIAARLGPLPGWTMGYGFDCYEYATDAMLQQWRDNFNAFSGWAHYMGARNGRFDITAQLGSELDYSSYENIQPEYDDSSFHIGFGYLQTLGNVPGKPSMSEDRFRLRVPSPFPWKDYTEEMTRRGLWDSAMAGGCANIWGNLVGATGANDGETPSAPYQNPQWSRTYATFFADRFTVDMVPAPTLTDGVCLRRSNDQGWVFYKQDASSIVLDLTALSQGAVAIAVDALAPYAEISLGTLDPAIHTWIAPYPSDWGIAVGSFD